MTDDPITLAEACKLFPQAHLTPATLRGALNVFQIGRRLYTTVADMKAWMLRDNISVVQDQPCCLYRHFDNNNRLLYVGISLNAIERLSAHRQSHWFDHVTRVEIEHFPTRQSAEAAERAAIRDENPKHNIRGKPPKRKAVKVAA